jgi:hypothetical protein
MWPQIDLPRALLRGRKRAEHAYLAREATQRCQVCGRRFIMRAEYKEVSQNYPRQSDGSIDWENGAPETIPSK